MANFDPAEFARTLERVAADRDADGWGPSKDDPKLRKDVRDDAIRGRKIDDYRQALEAVGMRWVPAAKLNLLLGGWNDGTPHRVGMWIHPDYHLQCAFTEDDILTHFPGGPEQFFNWMVNRQRRLAAQQAGLILPS